jgi:DNA-binding beta-propeller fold protein YncE
MSSYFVFETINAVYKSLKAVCRLMIPVSLLLFFGTVAAAESTHLQSLMQQVQAGQPGRDAFYVNNGLKEDELDAYYTELRDEITQPLAAWKLLALDTARLRLLRNEIFARKGYRFKSADLNSYFSSFDWYKQTRNRNEIRLSKSERENVNLMQRLEQLKSGRVEGFFNLLGGERSHRCETFVGENDDIIVTDKSLTFKKGMKYIPLETSKVPHAGGYAVTGLERVCKIPDMPYTYVMALDHEFMVTGSYYARGVTAYDKTGQQLFQMSGGGEDFQYFPDYNLYLSHEDQGSGGGTDVNIYLADDAGKVLSQSSGWSDLAMFVPAGGDAPLLWLFVGYDAPQLHDQIVALNSEGGLAHEAILPVVASVPQSDYIMRDYAIAYAGLVDDGMIYVRFDDKTDGLVVAAKPLMKLTQPTSKPVNALPRLFLSSDSHQYVGAEWPQDGQGTELDYLDVKTVIDDPFDVVYADDGKKLFVSQRKGNSVFRFATEDLASGIPEAALRVDTAINGKQGRLAYDAERDLLFVAPVEYNRVMVYSAQASGDDPPLFSFKTRECRTMNLYWDAPGDRLYLACGISKLGILSYQLDIEGKIAVEKSAFTPYVVLTSAAGVTGHSITPNDLYINHALNEAYVVGGNFDALLTIPADIFIDYPEEGLFYTGGKDLYFKEEDLGKGCRKNTWGEPSFTGDPVRLLFGRAKNEIGNRIDIRDPEHLLFDPEKDLFYIFGRGDGVHIYDRETDAKMSEWRACRLTYSRVKTVRRVEGFTAQGVDGDPGRGEILMSTTESALSRSRFREGEKSFPVVQETQAKMRYGRRPSEHRRIAVDVEGRRLFISDNKDKAILIFAEDEQGTMQRVGTIAGEQTQMRGAGALAVDSGRDLLYVFDGDDAILAFPLDARGDVAPVKSFGSPTPRLEDMAASAETGELFVVPGHFGGMRVLNQDGNGKKNRSFNGLGFPSAVAVDDQNDEVCVVDGQNILCYDRAASGAQKPKRKIVTELPLTDIAIDPASNSIYVLSKEKNQMLIYNRTAQGKAFPVQKIDLNDDTFGGSLLRRVDVASGLALLP